MVPHPPHDVVTGQEQTSGLQNPLHPVPELPVPPQEPSY
jgi:hypothetical protein